MVSEKGYSSLLSFTVTDINTSISKLMELGGELDGSIKYEVHGKVKAKQQSSFIFSVFPANVQISYTLLTLLFESSDKSGCICKMSGRSCARPL